MTPNQSVSVGIGSVALFSGRRLTVDKVIIHPKYDIKLMVGKERDALKEEITNLELNDTERNQEFYVKHKKNQKDYKLYVKLQRFIYMFDIALIKVKNRIIPVFNDSHYIVNGICLPKSHIINERNESVVIIGIGITEPKGEVSNRLKKGMSVMRRRYDECQSTAQNKNITRLICVLRLYHLSESLLKSGGCNGDSGSPLHQQYGCQAVQIGLYSMSAGMWASTGCGDGSGFRNTCHGFDQR